MFTIHNNQFDAFALPFAKKKRDRIIAELTESGIGNVYEEGRHVIVEDSRGNKTTIQFSEDYVPEKVIKPSGVEYGFEYDEEDRLIKFLLPGGEKIEWGYEGDLLVGVRLNDVLTSFEYDEEERLTAIIYTDGKKIKIGYNQEGRISKIIDRIGAIRTFETLLRERNLVYRSMDELNRITDYEYDNEGHVTKIIYPDGSIQTTEWNSQTQTEDVILKSGLKKSIYSNDFYVRSILFEDGAFVDIDSDIHGRIDALENENGTICYTYNAAGKIVKETFKDTETTLLFNACDLLEVIKYSSGLTVGYSYDIDSRLTAVNVIDQKCCFSYRSNDTLASILYSNSLIEKRRHSLLYGLKENLIETQWGECIAKNTYHFDSNFRLCKYFENNLFSTSKQCVIKYDDEGRIKEVRTDAIEVFDYNKKGNLVKINDQYIQAGFLDETLSVGNQIIDYDKAGNAKSFFSQTKGRIELNYGNNGILRSAEVCEENWAYLYDALGRRITKTNKSIAHYYYWFGEQLLSEKIVINGTLFLREYIYTPYNNLCIGFIENEQIFWLHRDVRGAVYAASDAKGNIVWSASYDAFGKAVISISMIRQPWRIMGQYHDEETDLYYEQSRYYCPVLKTYLSPVYKFDSTCNYSYSYCLNNPFNISCSKGTILFDLSPGMAFLKSIIYRLVNKNASVLGGTDFLNKSQENSIKETGKVSSGLVPIIPSKMMIKILNCLIN